MAEVLAVVGGIASFAQLLGSIIQTANAIERFCEDVKDAPEGLIRIRDKLFTLQLIVEDIQQYLVTFEDTVIFPTDLRETLKRAIGLVQGDIQTLQQTCNTSAIAKSNSTRQRLRWALIDRHVMEKLLSRLAYSENNLNSVTQLLNFRYSLLTCASIRQSGNIMDEILQTIRTTGQSDLIKSENGQLQKQRWRPISCRSSMPLQKRRQVTLNVDSWLRRLGFYGSFTWTTSKSRTISVILGYKLPDWMWNKSIDLKLQFCSLLSNEFGLRILPGHLRIQNRIPAESPFMVACRNGDVKLIRQHLVEGTGHVGDRTTCSGKNTLMLAIEGQHLEAIEYLLEAGVDPNIGDDDQVLPVFAVMGLNPRRKKHYLQVPPSWHSCIPALRLLVNYGASVHEIVHNRTLTTLNLQRHGFPEHNIFEFFQILRSESYIEFGAVYENNWSALQIAIRSVIYGLDALKFLSKVGVDLARIDGNGKSPLHMAAELTEDVRILEYLGSGSGWDSISRQDKWGWTAMHYAVIANFLHHNSDFRKVGLLLEHGADLDLKASTQPIFSFVPRKNFTPYELIEALDENLSRGYVEELRKSGQTASGFIDEEEEAFYDALEDQVG